MMNTIILSFQIWFPFLDSRSLDNSKSLFGKRFDLLSWPVPNQKQKGTTTTDKCYFYFFKKLKKKTISLALGPRSCPSSQGSASTFSLASSSSSLLHYLGTSLDNLSPRSHHFGLAPLTFRVEKLPPMAGYERFPPQQALWMVSWYKTRSLYHYQRWNIMTTFESATTKSYCRFCEGGGIPQIFHFGTSPHQ